MSSAKPRTAAACILVRGDAPEVLLARRNPTLRFMGGHYVFPGGAIDDGETAEHVTHATDGVHARAIQAAVREVFEETGLLCVRGSLPADEIMRGARHDLLSGELDFTKFLTQNSLEIDADDFAPAGEWVTPAGLPIRFQVNYFLYHVRDDQRATLIEGEIVGLDWLTAAEARERWHLGEIKISTPVAYTLRQLATAGLPAALPLLQRGTERKPGEHNWFEIRRGITMVPLATATIPPATHTNCIVVGEEQLYVIDPGADSGREQEHLYRQIDHLIEIGGQVEAVLLTHSHGDHTAGADAFRQRYDVPIMAHRATADQLSFTIDRHLNDGEVLISGGDPAWQLRCIHTPGHDPGHLCFLEESTGSLFAGDMVANPGTIFISRAYAGDMAAFMTSLERLMELECKLIIPAHGHPAGSPREFLQQHLDHRRGREEKIKQAFKSGAVTFDDLLAQVYDDITDKALPLARHSLDAHLAKLGIELPANSFQESLKKMTAPSNSKLLMMIAVTILIGAGVAVAGSDGSTMVAGMPLFALCAALAYLINWIVYIPANLGQTEKYFDLTGGFTYIAVTLTALGLTTAPDARAYIVAALVMIWAARLSSFLFLRISRDGKDGRFDQIKVRPVRFFLTWTIQGLWVLLTSAAALAVITGSDRQSIGWVAMVGLVVWVIGFLIEVIADRQKSAFKADPANEGRFITTGLWSWSRHPNYFGEIVIWIGVAIIALPVLHRWQYVTLISPVFVTLLLTKVSGIPMLEKRAQERWGDEQEFQAYTENTSVLIPLPPKK